MSQLGSRLVALRRVMADPLLDTMNLLNEVVLDFPDAISFAPGRPPASFFGVDRQLEGIATFVRDRARQAGRRVADEWEDIGQYSRTNGIITDAIALHLERDEGIRVDPEAIMITVGAQEAMVVLLAGLFEPGDILLVSDPTYIGMTAVARLLGVRTIPVPAGDSGLCAATVQEAIARASREGRVRALYDIPDFNNPLGTRLPLAERLALLDVCRRADVLFIEDNAYGMFSYDSARLPTLKALDHAGSVLYIGSLSKTVFPSLRIGYLVADQAVESDGRPLARALSAVKSLITVNTPALCQAIAASTIARGGGSLESLVAPRREHLRRNRDLLLNALQSLFSELGHLVSWNRPAGGFFVTMTLPFDFGGEQLRLCASNHGVIVCPMQMFTMTHNRNTQLRLSFSSVDPTDIHEGVARLAAFVKTECSVRGVV